MPRINVTLTGSSATYKSRSLSAQVTRNFMPMVLADNEAVKSKYILESFVGMKPFYNGGISGVGRGLVTYNDSLYRVVSDKLYSVDTVGNHNEIGSIAGNKQCIFEIGIDGLLIANGQGRVYRYNGTLAEITDSDLESPSSVAYLNAKAIYDGRDGRFAVSDVGDSTSINALNYGTAESNTDDLVRGLVFAQRFYAFGEKTIEVFWDSPAALNPPLVRVEGAILQVGLGAFYSLAANDTAMFFLSDDKRVYVYNGNSIQKISTTILEYTLSGYSVVSDAIGWCMTLRGLDFYCLTLPTAKKTWVYYVGGDWFEWSSGVLGERCNANSYANCYGKNFVEDYQNSNIYELDFETYTDNNQPIIRQRDSGVLRAPDVDPSAEEIEIKYFELLMETRVGDLSGEGHDPQIILQLSFDGGRTFGVECVGMIGNSNQDFIKVYWYNLGRSREVIFRVKISDPVYVSIHSAVVDVEVIA